GEDGDRQEEVVAAAEVGREPAGDRQDDRVGRQVGGDDPVGVGLCGRQAAGDVAQGHVGDRRVEDLHERRHDDHGGDDPVVDPPTAGGGRDAGHGLGLVGPGGGGARGRSTAPAVGPVGAAFEYTYRRNDPPTHTGAR